ncbi:hypothetical protein A0H81_13031 [Grifola frondosa]|uniref:DUF6533 domain-containing protein n=1 Tax=Grifola frondosa TaxID=5627 RepID=A0A1C7LW41_GRIFR|nr:hypothetical protein A0H81_13031 [Grifola frondosa]
MDLSQSALWDANATKYLSAAGLVVILYDHLLTLSDEAALIWTASASFAKYTFLANRYLVLGALIAVAFESCGLTGYNFSDEVSICCERVCYMRADIVAMSRGKCRQFLFTCSMLAVVSVGIANLLVLQRVVILWEHRPIVLKIMTAGFLASFIAQVVTMVITLTHVIRESQASQCPSASGLTHLPHSARPVSPVARMCVTTQSSHLLIAVWGAPMLFEVFVLASTSLNALDRPRTTQLPIAKALYQDGIGYFLAITCLRVLNLTLAALARPALTLLAVFFVWALTTTVLNRLLLHLRHAETRADEARRRVSRAMSPFGLAAAAKDDDDEEPEEPPEVVESEYRYHYRKRTYNETAQPKNHYQQTLSPAAYDIITAQIERESQDEVGSTVHSSNHLRVLINSIET